MKAIYSTALVILGYLLMTAFTTERPLGKGCPQGPGLVVQCPADKPAQPHPAKP